MAGSYAGFQRIGLWFRITAYLPNTFTQVGFQPGKVHSAINVGTEISRYRAVEFVEIVSMTVNHIPSDLNVVRQYLVDKRHIDMLSHMLGKLIILFFLKLLIVECFCRFRQFTGKRFKQKSMNSGLSRIP